MPDELTDPPREDHSPLTGHGEQPGVQQIVLHAMGERIQAGDGTVFNAPDWLRRRHLSVHAMARPDGTLLYCVPTETIAWHAKGYNTGRIGIEVLVSGVHTYATFCAAIGMSDGVPPEPMTPRPMSPYTVAQLYAAAWWCRQEAARWGLGWEAITTHQALDPTRKPDPGAAFPTETFQDLYERIRLPETA